MATGFSLCSSMRERPVIEKPPQAVELADFQPLDPWKSSELVVRSRKLPHLEVAGAKELEEKVEYMPQNPAQLGLADSLGSYK